jgi:hypothetical protein
MGANKQTLRRGNQDFYDEGLQNLCGNLKKINFSILPGNRADLAVTMTFDLPYSDLAKLQVGKTIPT